LFQGQQGGGRGRLLGSLLVAPFADTQNLAVKGNRHTEDTIVVRPFDRHNAVPGRGLVLGLDELLEPALVVAFGAVGQDALGAVQQDALDDRPRRLEPAVEIDRADHRFGGVGQDR